MEKYLPPKKTPAKKLWKQVGITHHHGILTPLFSLHSKKSCGIGEFPDLIPMIRWCSKIGLDILQLLPLNDTGAGISPYSAISAMALNPIHLGLADLQGVSGSKELSAMQKLTKEQFIDYETVRKLKERFMRRYFKETGEKTLKSSPCRRFLEENPWIGPYADFKGGNPDYHRFLQYLCYKQMTRVKKEAERNGVFIKGDIPILISPDSVEVKTRPSIFRTDLQAGAPPDRYIEKGQNWGFPLYEWENNRDEVMEWWKQRLTYASHFYHLYRLDHVVGLYRIWAIPKGKKAKEGFFVPKNRKKWIPMGDGVLSDFIKGADLFPIAEDLGTVPRSVKESLTRLGIPGTRVVRWERKGGEAKGAYIPPEDYPFISMTTLSTHDTETVEQWWRGRPEEAKPLCRMMGWSYEKKMPDAYREELLCLSHHSGSAFHINLLQEYLPLVEGFTWGKPQDERINRPDRNLWKNWRYRYRPSIEELVSSPECSQVFRDLLCKKTSSMKRGASLSKRRATT